MYLDRWKEEDRIFEMEGSESEAIFNSLNINPQQFINSTLNNVDDILDDFIAFYHHKASTLLKIESTDRSQHLIEGIRRIREMIESVLGKRLGMWEMYCLHHSFAVPEGFTLPQNNESPNESSLSQDSISDPDLDAQLDSLREKLTAVGKESGELISELRTLEKQSASSDHCAGLINEALKLYEEKSVHDMFQEMVRTSSELRTKMEKLRTRRIDVENNKMEKIYSSNRELTNQGKGISNAKLEDLQVILADIKSM
ncbi:Mis12 domain-containing protein [Cephalotus follicularis]|uniref:Mis12 domain-containing protein n=1 Tax=Cephalotus follicularis TaxID=3775 RepID=A0A1Q3B7C3_CEPFO|nr:Mis12 domain-containing protein [Cephalotus follicularis]